MAIRLQATPSVVVWSVNEQTLPDAKAVAAAVSADRCSVQVLCEGGLRFEVRGLQCNPYALSALIPLAMWNAQPWGKR